MECVKPDLVPASGAFSPHVGPWVPISGPEHLHLYLATWKVCTKCELVRSFQVVYEV